MMTKRLRHKRFRLARGLLAVAALAVAVEKASSQEKVPVTFQVPSAIENYQAAYFYGIKKGFYAKEGIDLTVKEGTGSMATAEKVAKGEARIAAADASVLTAFDGRVKMIASILPAGLSAIVYRTDRGIRDLKDLKGKKIGVNPRGGATRLLPTVLSANGLKLEDVALVHGGNKERLEKLKSGEIDAMIWSVTNQKYVEVVLGKKIGIFSFAAHGAPSAGEGIIVGSKMIGSTTDRDLLCKFLRATRKSWVEASKDVKGAVDALHELVPGIDGGDKSVSTAGWKKTIEITQIRASRHKPFGFIFEDDWSKLLKQLRESGAQKDAKPVSAYVSNAFVDCMNQGAEAR